MAEGAPRVFSGCSEGAQRAARTVAPSGSTHAAAPRRPRSGGLGGACSSSGVDHVSVPRSRRSNCGGDVRSWKVMEGHGSVRARHGRSRKVMEGRGAAAATVGGEPKASESSEEAAGADEEAAASLVRALEPRVHQSFIRAPPELHQSLIRASSEPRRLWFGLSSLAPAMSTHP